MGGLLLVPIGIAKCFELEINDEKCQICGKQLGLKTGTLADFESYDQVWESFEKQVKYFMKMVSEISNVEAIVHRELNRTPVKSALMDSYIESGRNINDEGAKYYSTTSFPAGLSKRISRGLKTSGECFWKKHRSSGTI